MSGRRGVFKLLGAVGLIPDAMAQAAAPRPMQAYQITQTALNQVGGSIPESGMPDAWKLLRALTKGPEQRQRREDLALMLTNGWPPHIAVMRSNAMWFRAMSAARWIQAREDRRLSLWNQLRRKVGLPTDD
jgi:hypothetical protein